MKFRSHIFIKYYKSKYGNRDMFEWISFDSSSCTGSSPVETYITKEDCPCNYDNWIDDESTAPRYDCEECKGSGERIRINYGGDKCEFLADNAKDYLKSLLNGALKKL